MKGTAFTIQASAPEQKAVAVPLRKRKGRGKKRR
jgi:hypothetical protein